MKDRLIRIAKYLYFYLPDAIKSWVVKRKQEKELLEAQKRAKRSKVSKENVANIINTLDIGDCDIILHTSMMSIGKIQGGVKWVSKCLFDKADITENTILVSALPFRGYFKDFLEQNVTFDVRNAPIAMGGINEYIGMLPEAHRSIHPTHSVVAVGKNAEEYICCHHLDKTPFGENSPYYKIIKNRGKAVMFGASMNYFTCIHAVEDMIGEVYPGTLYDLKRYKIRCLDALGEELFVETPCHAPLQSCIRMMLPLKPMLLKNGIMKITPIGESEIEVVDLYQFTLFYLNEIKHGRSIYGRVKVSPKLKTKIELIEKTL